MEIVAVAVAQVALRRLEAAGSTAADRVEALDEAVLVVAGAVATFAANRAAEYKSD
jgi:hypothetical protein